MNGKKLFAPVSVIILCYECAQTIERATDSVFSQSLLPIELILIDDCSNDDDLTIKALRRVLKKAKQILNVRVLELANNSGSGRARNEGGKISEQPYIAILDADDIWHPQKIELQYNWMKANSMAVMTGHETSVMTKASEIKKIDRVFSTIKITIWDFLINNPYQTRGVMVKSNVQQRFPNDMYHSEDYYLWSEIFHYSDNQCFLSNLVLAFSFKNDFGAGGLSGNLLKMERGELMVITNICKINKVPFLLKCVVYLWSLLKFVIRVMRSLIRLVNISFRE